MVISLKMLNVEIHDIKTAQSDGAKKRRRPTRMETRFKLASPAVQKTLSSLGDVKCTTFMHVNEALPYLFHSVQILLSADTTTEQAIQAASTLSDSLVSYLDGLISNSRANSCMQDPTPATQTLFNALAQFYKTPTLTDLQQAQVGEIIMETVSQILNLLQRSCEISLNTPIDENNSPRDYRDTFVMAILPLSIVTPIESPLRQALILWLLLEIEVTLNAGHEDWTRDYITFLYYLSEQVILRTRRISATIQSDVKRILWGSLLRKRDDEMHWTDEIIWRLCGLLNGIAGLDLINGI
jgi:hypothetical protein